jgi:hypothetical protein
MPNSKILQSEYFSKYNLRSRTRFGNDPIQFLGHDWTRVSDPNTIVGFEKKHILNKIHLVNSEFYLTFKYRVFRWIILRAYLLVTAFFFCELHNVYRFVCSFFILTEIKILFSGLSVLNVYHLRPVTIALPKRDIILALLLLGNSKLLVTLALQHF